ncbi:hypothetical protein CDAR_577911 [Caerostris darwini]|uniref:Uncharacterized protein n=1 Tax=Caerostris darwini TaxID=1538125 RepID=A0AAV4QSH1_9ARAC|nr:hypothetical protein CDAR_577911 [Caerostris darwini]
MKRAVFTLQHHFSSWPLPSLLRNVRRRGKGTNNSLNAINMARYTIRLVKLDWIVFHYFRFSLPPPQARLRIGCRWEGDLYKPITGCRMCGETSVHFLVAWGPISHISPTAYRTWKDRASTYDSPE